MKGYFLAAAATWVLGAGVTLTAYKAHRSAVGAAGLLSEHRREAARGRALLAELRRSVQKSQAQRDGVPPFLPLEPHTGTSSLQADPRGQPEPCQPVRTISAGAGGDPGHRHPSTPSRQPCRQTSSRSRVIDIQVGSG